MPRWSIEVKKCEVCRLEHERRESAVDRWKRLDGRPLRGDNRVSAEEWGEFLDAWIAEVPEVPCFYFLADCCGDEIALCLKHLRSAYYELLEANHIPVMDCVKCPQYVDGKCVQDLTPERCC